ncbi:hypothetical protein [Kordia sp.]
MKNKADKKRTVKKLVFKTVKISNMEQTKIVGGYWTEEWGTLLVCL